MPSIKIVEENIEAHKSMKGLVEVYEEMAAETMRKIREAILASREYYGGLATLSAEVGADLSILDKTKMKQNALVLLSSDQGMYGSITDQVFSSFIKSVKEKAPNTDVYVVGKIGTDLMRVMAPSVTVTPLFLGNVATDQDIFAKIIGQLVKYVRVEIFFGQFQNIVRQNSTSRVLSAAEIELTAAEWAGAIQIRLKYLYEPSVEQIAKTFGEQIFAGILEQTVKEDELSKNASRLMHLDHAWGEIEDILTKDTTYYRKTMKRIASKKQQIQLSGYSMRTHMGRLQ